MKKILIKIPNCIQESKFLMETCTLVLSTVQHIHYSSLLRSLQNFDDPQRWNLTVLRWFDVFIRNFFVSRFLFIWNFSLERSLRSSEPRNRELRNTCLPNWKLAEILKWNLSEFRTHNQIFIFRVGKFKQEFESAVKSLKSNNVQVTGRSMMKDWALKFGRMRVEIHSNEFCFV